jgi:hypothetical protein
MGEIHEESRSIDHWVEDDLPGLGYLRIGEDDILTDVDLEDLEPLEKVAEGYTGNAGMTLDYWYHFGAIILWPKENTFDLLETRPLQTIMD